MRIHRKNWFLLAASLLAACSTAEDSPESPETSGEGALEASAFQEVPTSGAFGPDLQDPQDPSEVAPLLQRRDAKRRILAKQFVERADEAFARGDFQESAVLYAEAFELDPTSRNARDGLRRSEAALGGEGWDVDSAIDQLAQQQLRWARERMRVEGLVSEGDRMMAKGEFAQAADQYRSAQLALNYSPNLATDSLDLDLVAAKLSEAETAQTSAADALRAQQAAEAQAAANAELEAQAQYQENLLRTLFAEADTHFQQGFYDRTVQTLDRVLELDPRNEEANELRQVALDAYYAQRQNRSLRDYREGWKSTFQELRQLAVPPKSILEFDNEYWHNEVSKRVPLDQVSEDLEIDPAKAAIEAVLADTSITPRFDNLVEEVADNLSVYTGVNFVVSRAVREDLDDDTKTVRMLFSTPMSVDRILRIIEDQTAGQIRFVIDNGVVNVITAEEASGGQVVRNYQVRDIIRKVRDFVGKEINLSPSGGIDEVEEELPEKEATILTDVELQDAIQSNIEPDAWDDTAFLQIHSGTLIVYANPSIHERIAQLLDDLRKAANIMVNIQVRFLKVEDSFLQDIGVDMRGLGDDATSGLPGKGSDNILDDFGSDPGSPGSPGVLGTGNDSGLYYREAGDNVNIISRTENLYSSGLGNENTLTNSGGLSLQYTYLDDADVGMILRAVEKSKRSEVVTQSELMVYNTSRANLTIANQVSYVADFDVEIAQAAAIADPIVRVAKDGIFLDVRPVVTADRRFAYIDVRPTVATLRRPIPTFQTSLGAGSPVTLQLPELEVQKVRTRVLVPDGSTILLGGLKVAEEQELDSGVPFLSQIPVVSFFFSRKGTYESYQKLIILLTAQIVIPSELEPPPLPGTDR
ncbi:MAG: hypothetical protein DWQ01_13855 [Planctomycetota bacterium]|nr:MAG: hypothetical protein DWQ01_13855 [Planctomycetota bacterium]